MAKRAKPEAEEAAEVTQPDFERAIAVLRGDVNPTTEETAKLRGDLSAAWKTIENDCHCNKKAMKWVHALMRMDQGVRDDVLRTLYGGMKAANIGISEDLISLMGDGETPTMPVVKREAPPTLAAVN